MIKQSVLVLVLASSSFFFAACQPGDTDESDDEVNDAAQAALSDPAQPFDVLFTSCEDTAGITPISRAAADAMVPDGFQLAGSGPTAPFVVRVASCEGVSVDGGATKKATVVQVGLTIVAPDGNHANLNNYTGWYYTDHKALAERLGDIGMDAQWVPNLKYKYKQNAAGNGGTLLIKVPGDPSFTINGEVFEPTVAPTLYEANWWQDGSHGLVQLDTILPAIAFGTAPVLSITAPAGGEIADLTGATTTAFTTFHSFSRSTPELMHVSIAD